MAILRSYSAVFEQSTFTQAAVARYRFNEGSGADIAVDSVDGRDGEYQTGAAPGVAGFIGDGAASFDGNNGFVLVNNTLTGTITVSAFGDSLIAGNDIPVAADRFSPNLEAALEARGLDATVINQGVGGNTSAQGLARVDNIIDDNPDVVIVEFGTNDALQGRTITDVDDDLRAIVTQLQNADIEVLLTGAFGFYPQRNGGTGYADAEDRDSFEALFPSIASGLGVELLNDSDGSDKFLGGERIAGDPDTIEGGVLDSDDPSLQVGDGLHPNAAGVDVIVPRVVPQVVELGAAAGVINDAFELANGSVELWFRPDSIGLPRQMLLSKNVLADPSAGDIEIQLIADEVAVGMQTESQTFSASGGSVSAGEDVHVVVNFGAGGLQLFVNGVLVDTEAGFTGGLVGNIEELALGARVNGEAAFDGVIDEVAIYDRALTAEEIGQLFEGGEFGSTVIGTAAAEELIGGSDSEELRGAGGNDMLFGNDGGDELHGGSGMDVVQGGPGNDRIDGGRGADVLRGGDGDDSLDGKGGRDDLAGVGDNDVLLGGSGGDQLAGGAGADELFGEGGFDRLRGGSGDDLLNGGNGRDTLVGGSGSDSFQLDDVNQGIDRILDFEAGAGGDVLDLSAVLDFGDGDDIEEFVRLDEVAGNTKVEVDPNGGGDSFTRVFNLIGTTGLDIGNLVTDGNIDPGAPTS